VDYKQKPLAEAKKGKKLKTTSYLVSSFRVVKSSSDETTKKKWGENNKNSAALVMLPVDASPMHLVSLSLVLIHVSMFRALNATQY